MFKFCAKCREDTEVKVDRATLKNKQATSDTVAVCLECNEPQELTLYAIKSLVTMGQFYEKPKAEGAFAFHCDGCKKTEGAILSSDKKKATCGNCKEPLNVSEYMIKAMILAKGGAIDTLG